MKEPNKGRQRKQRKDIKKEMMNRHSQNRTLKRKIIEEVNKRSK